MKLGELKIESLRIMGVNEENLTTENLSNYYYDERYRDYLDRMPGAINRAISRFLTYKVIPTKTAEIRPSQCETYKQFLKMDLNKILATKFNSLERIVYIYERVVPDIEYQTLTDGVVLIEFSSSYVFKGEVKELPNKAREGDAYYFDNACWFWDGEQWQEVEEDEMFVVEYVPKIPLITSTTDNNTEIDLPDALVRIIPYFVKAELYELDEPNLSAMARNVFESALTEYVSFGLTKKQRQQYVKNTFL
jgi:hypothetical protein